MIFVTVGTIQFDELVRFMDESVAAGLLPERVVIQIANGTYRPKHCEYFTIAPDLAPYHEKAEIVVGHGGTGTTMEVLRRGLPLISVCNSALADNHQDEFLTAMSEFGVLTYCRSFQEIIPAIDKLRDRAGKSVHFDESLIRWRLIANLGQLALVAPRKSSMPGVLRRLARRMLSPIHDDQHVTACRGSTNN